MTYPSTFGYGGTATPGPSYNYAYDSMYRLSGMTDSNNNTIVSGVSYNPANQLLGITYNSQQETRTYNVLNQLTNITVQDEAYPYGTTENLTYNFPTGTNNGKIGSMYNAVSGETVTYTYDSLKRIATANGSGWGEQYTFDPFGNLTAKTVTAGSGPSMSIAVDQNTNHYGSTDANGNMLATNAGVPLTFDVENHIYSEGNIYYGQGQYYAYDAQGKRIYSWAQTLDGLNNMTQYTIDYYSVTGQKLGSYLFVPGGIAGYLPFINVTVQVGDQYFGARRLATMDELGSVGAYYPWGEVKGTTNPQDNWSYATYWRDSATSLDYAQNRYYSNAYGRFMTPDPYMATATSPSDPSNPQSWNRYAYVNGDPVNGNDSQGLYEQLLWASGGEDGFFFTSFNGCSPNWDGIWGGSYGCGSGPTEFQGPTGGASGPSRGIAHSPGSNVGPAGYSGAMALLQNASSKCLKDLDASSGAAAAATLQGSTIDYTGGLTPETDASGNIVNNSSPAQSYSESGNNYIDINLNFGWMNPTNLLVDNPSGAYYTNWVASVGNSVGDPNLTAGQYYELVLLHELGHLLGVPQETDNSYNTSIFNDCIKGN